MPEAEGGFLYVECMLRLCTIALDVVSTRTAPTGAHRELLRIEERWQGILAVEQLARAHLRELSACQSVKDNLEHWNWHMHRSYVVSELCRPMLTRHDRHDESVKRLRAVCIEALAATVDAFLNLHNLTAFARTSWAAVHRSLSSALLLAILKEPARNERVRLMLDRLITIMSSIEHLDASEMPQPVARAVAALAQLNTNNMNDDDGSSVRSETGSGGSVSEDSPHAHMYHILWGNSSTHSSTGGLRRV